MRSNRLICCLVLAFWSLFVKCELDGQTVVTVALDGTGAYTSIQKAIDSFRDDDSEKVVLIKSGTYQEKIFLSKNSITLRGEYAPIFGKSWENFTKLGLVRSSGVVIVAAISRDTFRLQHPDDWGAAVLNIRAHDVHLENLTVVNSFGFELKEEFNWHKNGASIAVKRDGHQFALRAMAPTQRLKVEHCNFYSLGGDTVSPWDTENGTYHFENCTIEGGVDLYCPRGWAVAENMHFICHNKNAAIWHDGSANIDAKSVIKNATFEGEPGYKLGRFHRDAQMYLINCRFSQQMADSTIYQVPTKNLVQWGKRIYYYNCTKSGKPYKWYRTNLKAQQLAQLEATAVFGSRWQQAGPSIHREQLKLPSEQTDFSKEKDTTYCNPILHLDYSDPDVIRVGADYYMTSSSFGHFPGLPILRSTDLVHWKIIGHAVTQHPDSLFDLPQHGNGIWAPSLRFHEGQYFIYFGDPDRGVFMTKAKSPEGPWSELKLIKKVTGWIDCCPFWDDDGKAYLVHAYANSRVGFKSILMMNEMTSDGEQILGTAKLVFNGQEQHHTIEGPKLYKRNGFYYIFAPAGGVATGWQTVLRSKSIFGPYEDKIVLEQGLSNVNGPHQGAWVTASTGEDWFVHFQDKGVYGRVTHLQPMCWVDDWPRIGKDLDGNGIGEPVKLGSIPEKINSLDREELQTSDEFDAENLGFQWQWQGNPKRHWYKCDPTNSQLRLFAQPHELGDNLWQQASLLLQKFTSERFNSKARLLIDSLTENCEAGLIVFGLDYGRVAVTKQGQDSLTVSVLHSIKADQGGPELVIDKRTVHDQKEFFLGVKVQPISNSTPQPLMAECQFTFSLDGIHYEKIGNPFVAQPGKWVGAKVGIYCLKSRTTKQNGFVDFDYFFINSAE